MKGRLVQAGLRRRIAHPAHLVYRVTRRDCGYVDRAYTLPIKANEKLSNSEALGPPRVVYVGYGF